MNDKLSKVFDALFQLSLEELHVRYEEAKKSELTRMFEQILAPDDETEEN